MSRADETAPSPLPQARPAFRLDPIGVLLGLAPAGFVAWRLLLPERPATDTGPRALADAAFALTFWAYLLVVGSGVGYTVLRLVRFETDSAADRLRFGIPIGLALLGFIPFFLGLAGFLYPGPLTAALGLAGLLVGPAARLAVSDFLSLLRGLARLERSPRNWLLAAVYAVLAFSALALALSPPTGYDDLWYHLEAPKLFLKAGRIYPEVYNWNVDYAFAIDAVYVFPLALTNDTVPQLLGWTLGVVLLASAYRLTQWFSPSLAWLAPPALLTLNHFPSLATAAGTDVPVACFELLGLELLLTAVRGERSLNLELLAVCLGLALGTKGTAIGGVGALGLILVFGYAVIRPGRDSTWMRPSTGRIAVSALIGFALFAPWYAKNWLWFGHPLFPFAGIDTDSGTALRRSLLLAYISSGYGVSRDLLGAIYLPIALFSTPDRFGYYVVTPMVLIFLIPAVLFLSGRISFELVIFVAVKLGVWFLTSQQIRFLISGLVVLVVILISGMPSTMMRRWHRVLHGGLVSTTLILVLAEAGLYLAPSILAGQWAVIMGFESREAYLTRRLPGFRALTFAGTLPPESRVLLVGDARHYYCPPTCWPEADQFTWTRLAMLADFDPERLVGDLRAMGITHILVSRPDVVFLSSHDPGGWFGRSVKFLYEELGPRCLSAVFVDRASEVYELTCPR